MSEIILTGCKTQIKKFPIWLCYIIHITLIDASFKTSTNDFTAMQSSIYFLLDFIKIKLPK